ncbi:ribonuclease P protein subunit RPR2 [Sporobolomyces koalae]|uniref:ribonuclease P protein subunit RPR2 n=1 Tax=Sporobolomyces koalae TaxID=500713 RepID=UPI00316F0704
MAKKGAKGVAEPTGATPVPSRDALQRLSYLYQASVLLDNAGLASHVRPNKRRVPNDQDATLEPRRTRHQAVRDEASEAEAQTDQAEEPRRADLDSNKLRAATPVNDDTAAVLFGKSKKRVESFKPISRHLVRMMKEVAKKATVRMDPAVKRTLCKHCDAVLVPGVSSSVRIKPSRPHAHLVVYTCSACLAQRRFPAPPLLAESAVPSVQSEPANLNAEFAPLPVDGPTAATSRDRRTKREKREARQAQQPVFFQKEGHVVIKGGTVIPRGE